MKRFSCSLTFDVECKLEKGQHLVIIGNQEQLGNWDHQNGFRLQSHFEDQWTSDYPLIFDNDTKIQFKLAKIKSKTGELVEKEDFSEQNKPRNLPIKYYSGICEVKWGQYLTHYRHLQKFPPSLDNIQDSLDDNKMLEHHKKLNILQKEQMDEDEYEKEEKQLAKQKNQKPLNIFEPNSYDTFNKADESESSEEDGSNQSLLKFLGKQDSNLSDKIEEQLDQVESIENSIFQDKTSPKKTFKRGIQKSRSTIGLNQFNSNLDKKLINPIHKKKTFTLNDQQNSNDLDQLEQQNQNDMSYVSTLRELHDQKRFQTLDKKFRKQQLNENKIEIVQDPQGEYQYERINEESILFCFLYLPVQVKYIDGTGWEILIHDNGDSYYFYNSFPQMKIMGIIPQQDKILKITKENKNASFDDLKQKLYKLGFITVVVDQSLINSLLQDLCHPIIDQIMINRIDPNLFYQFNKRGWESMQEVNKIYSQKILKFLDKQISLVFIHDYSIVLTMNYVSEARPHQQMFFNFNGVFPQMEKLKIFPYYKEFVSAILLADVINFQQLEDSIYFFQFLKDFYAINFETRRGSICIRFKGRRITINFKQKGINHELMQTIQQQLEKYEFQDEIAEIQEQMSQISILSIDYHYKSEDLSIRIQMIEKLLLQQPQENSKIKFVQICIPQPEDENCGSILRQINFLKTEEQRINKLFPDSVKFIFEKLPQYKILAYMQSALIFLCNSNNTDTYQFQFIYQNKREGCCLVDDISQFNHVFSSYISYNSMSFNSFKEKITKFINKNTLDSTNQSQKQQHIQQDKKIIKKNHQISLWVQTQICELIYIRNLQECFPIYIDKRSNIIIKILHSPKTRPLNNQKLYEDYKQSKNRVIIMGYQGTLQQNTNFDYVIDRKQSFISKKSLQGVDYLDKGIIRKKSDINTNNKDALKILTEKPENTVYILSELPFDFEFFKQLSQQIPNLGIVSDGGYYYKNWECKMTPNIEWYKITDFPNTWKPQYLALMKEFTEKIQGSYIIEKQQSLTWTYEEVEPDYGQQQASILEQELMKYASQDDNLEIISGKNYVEVKPQLISKSITSELILKQITLMKGEIDFIMVIGFGMQNEDLFSKVKLYTQNRDQIIQKRTILYNIHVGNKPTNANCFINSNQDVQTILQDLSIL